MPTQLSKIALDLVNRAPTNGSEAEVVAAVKQWLTQISEGLLVVGTPVPPKPKKAKQE